MPRKSVRTHMQTIKATRLVQPLMLVGILLITFTSVLAQNTAAQPDASPIPADSPQSSAAQAQPSPSPAASPPRVIKATGDVELDDIITVHIENLEKWAETN